MEAVESWVEEGDGPELTQYAVSDVMSPERLSFRAEPIGKEPSPVRSQETSDAKEPSSGNMASSEEVQEKDEDGVPSVVEGSLSQVLSAANSEDADDSDHFEPLKSDPDFTAADGDLIQFPDTESTEKPIELTQHLDGDEDPVEGSALSHHRLTDNFPLSDEQVKAFMDAKNTSDSLWPSRPGTVIEQKNPNTILFQESKTLEKYECVDLISMDVSETLQVQPSDDASRYSISDTVARTGKAPISSSTPLTQKDVVITELKDKDAKSDSGRASSPASGELGGTRGEKELKEMLQMLNRDLEAYGQGRRDSDRQRGDSCSSGSKQSETSDLVLVSDPVDGGSSPPMVEPPSEPEGFVELPQEPVSTIVVDVMDEDGAKSVVSDTSSISDILPPVHVPSDSDTDSLAHKVASLLAQAPVPCADSSVDALEASAVGNSMQESETDDLERISKNYQSLLRDHAEGSGPIEFSDESSLQAAEAKKETKPAEESGALDASESEADDALSRDVKSILAKYGHAFADSEDDQEPRQEVDEEEVSRRMHLMTIGDDEDSEQVIQEELPTYAFDDPAKSMSIPHLADTSKETSIEDHPPPPERSEMQRDQPGTQGESDDELGYRVRDILTNTSHLKKGSSSKSTSKQSSVASSLDFGAIEKDLDEIRFELDSMKSGSRRSSSSSYRNLPGKPPELSSEKSDSESEAEPKRPLVDLGVDPLLTNGVIPLDIALEIVHSGNYDASGRPKVDLDGSLASVLLNQSRTVPSRGPSTVHDVLEVDHHADSEVEDIIDGSRDVSSQSLTTRVQNILERGSPPRQAYKYLEEARAQEEILEKSYRDHERQFAAFQRRLQDSAVGDQMESIVIEDGETDRQMSPLLPMTPFNKLKNMRSIFTSQMDKASHLALDQGPPVRRLAEEREDRVTSKEAPSGGEFENEFEMRRKLIRDQQRRMEEELLASENRSSDFPDPGSFEGPRVNDLRSSQPRDSFPSLSREFSEPNTLTSRLPSQAGLAGDTAKASNSRDRGNSGEYRLSSSKAETAHTPYVSSNRTSVLRSPDFSHKSPTLVPFQPRSSDERYYINLGKYDGDISLDALNSLSQESSEVVDTSGQSQTSPESHKVAELRRESRSRYLPQQKSTSRESSLTPPSARRSNSRSPDNSESSHRRLSPRGSRSHDILISHGGDDGAGSIAGYSETTVESTHPGSDDARGPHFPAHILGSRPDPPSDAVGIYGSRLRDPGPTPLFPIREQPSLTQLNDSKEDNSAGSKSLEDLEKSRRSEKQERSFKRAETWVKGNFSSGGHYENKASSDNESQGETDSNQCVGDVLSSSRSNGSENNNNPAAFGTPPKAKMASKIREMREEVMRKFGYTAPPYVSSLVNSRPLESTSYNTQEYSANPPLMRDSYQHLPQPRVNDEDYFAARYDASQLMNPSYSSHGIRGFATYEDSAPSDPNNSTNSINTDELLHRVRNSRHTSSEAYPLTSPTRSCNTSLPLDDSHESRSLLRSDSPSLPRLRPRSPPYHEIPGPDGTLEPPPRHFRSPSPTHQEHVTPPRSPGMRTSQGSRSPSRGSANVVDCSPEVIRKSPSRELFRSLDSARLEEIREQRDRQYERLIQTAKELSGRESPEVRLPRNMEDIWQRYQDQRRSLELSQGSLEERVPHRRATQQEEDHQRKDPPKQDSGESCRKTSEAARIPLGQPGKSMDGDGGGSEGSDHRGNERHSREPEDALPIEQESQDASGSKQDNQEMQDNSGDEDGKPRKMAWVIRDETLPSVPEDSTLESVTTDLTTSSEIDSDGKMVTHTTKKHLPADPKLLKLQRKIAQQKEKHRHDRYRELKRKEKIVRMERLLKAKERALRQAPPPAASVTPLSTTLTSSDFTTDSSTLTEDTLSLRESTTSPERSRRAEEFEWAQKKEVPAGLKLQQVDYNRRDAGRREGRAPRHKPAPQRQQSPPRWDKENEEHHRKNSKEARNMRTRGEMKVIRDHDNADVYLKKKTRDFGATCPTPISQTPKRKYHSISMVSEGVQTSPLRDEQQVISLGRDSPPRKRSPGRKSPPRAPKSSEKYKMFVPEAALEKRDRPIIRVKPKPAVSWFVPVEKQRSLRDELDSKYSEDPRPKFGAWTLPARDLDEPKQGLFEDAFNTIPFSKRSNPQLASKGLSLQEAFERRKKDFISASRERQKHVAIRAEERRIQELHRLERAKLFGFVPRKRPNPEAHPISDQHFKPQQRFMSRREMKELTQKMYKKLPEVVRAAEEKKRADQYQLNRLRAKLYQKRIQNLVLKKPSGWLRG